MKARFTVKSDATSFGRVLRLPKKLAQAPVVIICVNDNTGLVPVYLCMPHQVYKEKIVELLKQYPGTKNVTIIPASNLDYFDVWEEKYDWQVK